MPHLRVDTDAHAVRVLFDAAHRRNALGLDDVRRLLEVLEEEPTRTLLLGSSTPGIFSAGADLAATDEDRAALSDLLYACYERLVSRPGITIAVVEGAAVGGGAQLSAAADLRTITAQARWRWVGPGHGLAVGSWILPDLVGRARGLDLTLTSRWMDAEEAVAAGFAPGVDDDAWGHARRLAERLSGADAAALTRVKHSAHLPALLEQLAQEREQNRRAWRGSAPTPRVASAEGRRLRPGS